MKVAFLSDVHANLPALRAALATARREGARAVVVAGDVVGEGPHPREVVAELRRRHFPAVRGNQDRKTLELGMERPILVEGLSGAKPNLAWTALQLLDAPDERAWLAALPGRRGFRVGGRGVLVVHGSPLGDTDYVYPSLTVEGLRAKLEPLGGPRPDVLVCGHSHVPFTRVVDGVAVVNCGSVGRPADGDPRGSLAIVDFAGPDAVNARVLRFTYPVDRVVADLLARRVPGIDGTEYPRGVKT